MPIGKSIFNCDVLLGEGRLSKVYVGSDLVYKLIPNVFVFEITSAPTTIVLQEDLRGDPAKIVITSWGDGTNDQLLSHTYNEVGTYQVTTRYSVVSSIGEYDATTINSLINVLSISNKINTCAYMFYNCTNLATVESTNWDTSRITDMSYMFYKCSSLEDIDYSNWDTSNVNSAAHIFGYCNFVS